MTVARPRHSVSVVWPDWMTGAPCAGRTAAFFPDDPFDTGPAKRVCGTCPFQAACRAWGLTHLSPQWDGIYGGLTLAERRLEARFGVTEGETCSHGHKFTAENTAWDSAGCRRCVECRRGMNAGRDRSRQQRAS